jgi:hypothetical protein
LLKLEEYLEKRERHANKKRKQGRGKKREESNKQTKGKLYTTSWVKKMPTSPSKPHVLAQKGLKNSKEGKI